ncbi:MAG: hypothetical protein H0U18_03520 [Pyrinomonadaceae bacterium]|nr:hypothetical protein [Pyrinomonadaceae bacterium]
MNKILTTITVLLFACATCVGQSSYKGLTPGQSTRADVERVLGQPVKSVSKTLVEYESPEDDVRRLYVQYRNESPTAIVERIERTCVNDGSDAHDTCGPALNLGPLQGVLEDIEKSSSDVKQQAPGFVRYYGAPRFMVFTLIAKGTNTDERLAFYSKELYESVVPKSGCTGTIFGTWQTDRGRMTVQRVGDSGVQGTYSKNNGTFSLRVVERGGYQGTWKDNTGTGEMTLLHDRDTFSATWTGPGARVPPNETQKPSVSKEREQIGATVRAMIEKIEKSGKGAAIGATTPDEPSLRNKGLPPGEPWRGKCVP